MDLLVKYLEWSYGFLEYIEKVLHMYDFFKIFFFSLSFSCLLKEYLLLDRFSPIRIELYGSFVLVFVYSEY